MKRIAILTSGGDCPGMNVCIKTITNICTKNHIEVVGFKYGYQGLIDNNFQILNDKNVENIDVLGGTILKTSRCDAFKTEKGVLKGAKNLLNNKIDALIAIGGNGTLKGAEELCAKGVSVIGIPATIDNDVFASDFSIGFDTAVNNAVDAISKIKQTAQAIDRAMIIEVMGRDCGDIALNAAFVVGANAFDCKELNFGINNLVKQVKNAIKNGIKAPIIIVSEGVNYSLETLQKAIEKELKIEARINILGYLQRGGEPSVFDKKLAKEYCCEALKNLINNKKEFVTISKNSKIMIDDLKNVNKTMQIFNKTLYDKMLIL